MRPSPTISKELVLKGFNQLRLSPNMSKKIGVAPNRSVSLLSPIVLNFIKNSSKKSMKWKISQLKQPNLGYT